ncbi:outer membrane protein [Helicobacter bizzozeronii]|uniref:outer membrane protein n=1 Tax=Helicobacter bizzozeronii TaxID=56877 RepID=UPI000CF02ABF|nr:outer membrane protein [Helicobacter bizzozeronii]
MRMVFKQLVRETRVFFGIGFFSLLSLGAESSGVFLGGGFQYSYASGAFKQNTIMQYTIPGMPALITKTKNPYNGNLFGGDIQMGYKLFFGQKKRFGLRFYGFFSGQAGYANSVESSQTDPKFVVTNQPGTNLFYGGGMDMLYNFYDSNERSFGVFAGVVVGWSSWSMGKDKQCRWASIHKRGGGSSGCITMNEFFNEQVLINHKFYPGLKSSFSPAFVQLLVNLGFRFNFTKHQGLEVGVRLPTINNLYYVDRGTYAMGRMVKIKIDSALILRRDIVAFVNYVINF